jgi:hypothetical protein
VWNATTQFAAAIEVEAEPRAARRARQAPAAPPQAAAAGSPEG